MSLSHGIRKIWITFLDILFPIACIGCGKEGTSLCLSCLARIPPLLEMPGKETFALFPYTHPLIRESIWALKYRNRQDSAENLGKVLYEKILEEYTDLLDFNNFTEPLLVAIPLSSTRMRERGYNQAELIVKSIQRYDQEKLFTFVPHLLHKIHDTKRQAGLRDRRERLKNLHDCFQIAKNENVSGRNIILIDDVVTTGATLAEARRVLKEAGARKVIAFTIAH